MSMDRGHQERPLKKIVEKLIDVRGSQPWEQAYRFQDLFLFQCESYRDIDSEHRLADQRIS
jgi:hypothetical protein